MRQILFTLFTLCTLLAPSLPLADELDQLLSGFEEDSTPLEEQEEDHNAVEDLLGGFFEDNEKQSFAVSNKITLPEWISIQGSVSLLSTFNFSHDRPGTGGPDFRGPSQLRLHGELIADMVFGDWKMRVGGTAFYDSIYQLNDDNNYTEALLDEYEHESEINELYLHGPLSKSLDLKTGRQIVVWGKSDNLRVTDILTPLDRRYPGMVDIRYLRLPVTMTRLDYFTDNWSISTMLIHEPRIDKFPVYNSEFYPGESAPPSAKEPEWSWENQEIALSINGIFSGWDISFYGAHVFQEQPTITTGTSGTYREWQRATMVGTALNIAAGNWLIKTEAAFWDGIHYTTTDDTKQRIDILAGFEYSGFTETSISFEVVNRHIFEFEQILENGPDYQNEDQLEYAIRFVKNFRNDTIHFTMLFLSYGLFCEDGGFERFQLEYDVTDNITLTTGLVFYESGDHPLYGANGDNDRVLFEAEYRF